MAEKALQGPGIDSLVRQSIAAGVAEHVGVDLEWQFGLKPRPLNQLGETGNCERGAPLRGKDEGRLAAVLLQGPQGPEFIAEQGGVYWLPRPWLCGDARCRSQTQHRTIEARTVPKPVDRA